MTNERRRDKQSCAGHLCKRTKSQKENAGGYLKLAWRQPEWQSACRFDPLHCALVAFVMIRRLLAVAQRLATGRQCYGFFQHEI